VAIGAVIQRAVIEAMTEISRSRTSGTSAPRSKRRASNAHAAW
jgi:hypothetical protein